MWSHFLPLWVRNPKNHTQTAGYAKIHRYTTISLWSNVLTQKVPQFGIKVFICSNQVINLVQQKLRELIMNAERLKYLSEKAMEILVVFAVGNLMLLLNVYMQV